MSIRCCFIWNLPISYHICFLCDPFFLLKNFLWKGQINKICEARLCKVGGNLVTDLCFGFQVLLTLLRQTCVQLDHKSPNLVSLNRSGRKYQIDTKWDAFMYILKKWPLAKLSLNQDLSRNKVSLNWDCTVFENCQFLTIFFCVILFFLLKNHLGKVK